MADIGAARKLYAGSPLGHSLHILFFFFFQLNMPRKNLRVGSKVFFFFSLCLLFICRCTGGLFTLLKRMRDPRDTALHAKFLWKGLEKEKGRNFQAL